MHHVLNGLGGGGAAELEAEGLSSSNYVGGQGHSRATLGQRVLHRCVAADYYQDLTRVAAHRGGVHVRDVWGNDVFLKILSGTGSIHVQDSQPQIA